MTVCLVVKGVCNHFGLLCGVMVFKRLLCSLVSCEASRFSTYLLIQDSFTLRLTDTNAMNFSVTFIICKLIINQNIVDFQNKNETEKEMLTIRYLSWRPSDTN